MTTHLVALLVLAVALPGALVLRNDFHARSARVWFVPGQRFQLRFRRAARPGLFWVTTGANAALLLVMIAVGVLMLIRPDHLA